MELDQAVTRAKSFPQTAEVTADNLMAAFQNHLPEKAFFSFDCFDTLIWRKCSRPTDVFYSLQHKPAFKKIGLTANLRMSAESIARSIKYVETGSHEVTLRDIYLAAFPDLTDSDIEQLTNEEIEAEIEFCYAFQPMIAALTAAAHAGKKCIIVSDTYFTKPQLEKLLKAHLPQEVFDKINHIFASSEYGVNKAGGIFSHVISELGADPKSLFHIGDNLYADYKAPVREGIHAQQFVYQHDYVATINRLQHLSAQLIDPTIRTSDPLFDLYKPVLSTTTTDLHHPENAIGFLVLGQLMHIFASYIRSEYESLSKTYPNLKVAFLLRDGYLPASACEALMGSKLGEQVRISRFASFAASFRSKQDITNYIAQFISGGRYQDICKQLLLSKELTYKIISKVDKSSDKNAAFRSEILKDDMVNYIIKRSREYWARLRKYLEKSINLQDGDTLLFIDLGYSGTTQKQLEPILKNEMNVHLLGRYLIALSTPGWEKSKAGLIDASLFTDHAMLMVVYYIAILEQLSTTTDKSVVDFDDDGNPIYGESSLNEDQYEKLRKIQAACLQFIIEADSKLDKSLYRHYSKHLRQHALYLLARFIFLPTPLEINYLKTFKFDMNLGTSDTFDMMDVNLGLKALRERGLFFMERNSKTMRTNYPAELRHAGIELAIALMAQHRFNYEFTVNDTSLRRESIQAIVMSGDKTHQFTIEARPTFDGYFTLEIPVGAGSKIFGLLLGQKYKWIQIESINVIEINSLYGDFESTNTIDASNMATIDNMKDHGDGLFEMQTETALLLINVPSLGKRHYICRVVFRPISVAKQ